MTAVAAAREGRAAVILERSAHIGGLPANGLGATDIATRGATGGLFLEFVERVRRHYVETYGRVSEQVKQSSDGYHFEPRVAEKVFQAMIAEQGPRITVRLHRQFDAKAAGGDLVENEDAEGTDHVRSDARGGGGGCRGKGRPRPGRGRLSGAGQPRCFSKSRM